MITEKYLIDKYLGIPYKHMGRSKDGLDCWGLILSIYKELGHKLWDIGDDYEINWSKNGKNFFLENYYKDWTKVSKPNFLDVVLFKNKDGVAHHAGIYLSNDRVIHSCRIGTVVSRLFSPYWTDNIEGFYRLNGKAKD